MKIVAIHQYIIPIDGGEMGQKTKIFSGDTTIEDIVKWAAGGKQSYHRLTIEVPEDEKIEYDFEPDDDLPF